MKICILIPSYNEAKYIGQLLKQIQAKTLDILVVNDGSKDNTSQIAREEGALVLENKTNLGKGASLIKGFDYFLKKDYDVIITMDGDGQHSPHDIDKFIDKVRNSNAGVIIGNRMFASRNMPFLRWATNKVMSLIISKVCKQHIPDSQCGFRLIKKEVLDKIRLESSNFEIESELLIKVSRAGFKIDFVPITTIYQNHKSRINPFIDTLRFIKFIFKKDGL